MSLRPTRHAHALATFRWVEVRLMELLAAWVPSTPEMEVKLLLGEHLYNHARHADDLGRRLREQRAPLHDSRPPVAAYVELLRELSERDTTAERLIGLYTIVLPTLGKRYRSYTSETDPILDAPTVRIIEDLLRDMDRMRAEFDELRVELEHLALEPTAWTTRFAAAEAAVEDLRRVPVETGAEAQA